MSDSVSIANQALTQVGGKLIISFDDDTTEAQVCKAHYQPSADQVLRSVGWPCAIARASLAKLVEAPSFGYTYQYALPTDCLLALSVDHDESWKIEQRNLLTDAGTVNLRYIKRIPAEIMDAHLAYSVALCLAARISYPLAQNAALTANIWTMYRQSLLDASHASAVEGSSDTLVSSALTQVR